MNNDQANRLGTEPIGKLLLKFSVPAIVGMMVQSLYNFVDRIFIGQGVGSLGLAGATVSFPFMLVFMAFGMLIGIGGNAAVSISLGQKNKALAEKILGNSFLLLVILSAILSIAGLFLLDPLLRLSGASDAVLPYGRAYMIPILLGTIFNGIGFGMNNFIRGEGNPRTAMSTMLIGAGLNTILDPIFIFVFDMGIAGAAWATVISQTVSAIWVLAYYASGRSLLRIRRENLRLDGAIVRRIFAIGSAPFAMQLAASVLNIILNAQLLRYGGDNAISAMGILYSIAMVILMPLFGLNQGAQPIIGYNYGAMQYKRVVRTTEFAIIAASSVVLLGWAATRLFPEALIGIFSGGDTALLEAARPAMRIFFLCYPLLGFQIVATGYFMAVGKSKQAMFLTLSRQVLFLIPLLLILPTWFGLNGVFASAAAADALASVATGILFLLELRFMKSRQEGVHDHPEAPLTAPTALPHQHATLSTQPASPVQPERGGQVASLGRPAGDDQSGRQQDLERPAQATAERGLDNDPSRAAQEATAQSVTEPEAAE